MMQTAVLTYPDGRTELKPARIPIPPSGTLEEAFLTRPVLHLHAEEAGFTYSWDVNEHVRMIDTNKGIMYEWIPKPTMVDAVFNDPVGETYIFQKDGTVKLRTRPEPFSQPNLVWEHVWPLNPETILVTGEEVELWDDWEDYVTDHDDKNSFCSKCSSGERPPGYCPHFYETDDEGHEHPNSGTCYDSQCVPCPSCKGPYDGDDHGGLGCTRECAYGDWIREDRRDRW